MGAVLFYLLYGVVGPERFRAIIGGFYRQYAEAGGGTDDFVAFASKTAGLNLTKAFDDWVYTVGWWDAIQGGATYQELVQRYRPR
ncbi:MAG: hypothetical protein HY337_03330 [Gemmatimonadetes bacterium]|nr:hypothetical protein [Gemmatimonadota bacterium]